MTEKEAYGIERWRDKECGESDDGKGAKGENRDYRDIRQTEFRLATPERKRGP